VLAVSGANLRGDVVLYVHEGGTRAALGANGDFTQLLRLGYSVLAIDVSGVGETTPRWGSYSDSWFGNDKITWLALMVGKTMTGIRMEDISRSLDLLQDRGLLAKGKCIGFATGSVATDLLHTAVVDDRFNTVVMERGLISFGAIARTPIHRRVFERILPGVLGRYDLPDLVAALAPRLVWLSNPLSPMGQPVPPAAFLEEYRRAEGAYQVLQSADRFVYGRRRPGEELVSAYPGLR
jgi:hypothetical protein